MHKIFRPNVYLIKVTSFEASNFMKKETLAQVFSCEFCKISKISNLFYKNLWATDSASSFSQQY